MNNPAQKEFYLNPVARLFLIATQLTKVLIAGRGFSKSFTIGLNILKKVEKLPRSKGLFTGPAYTQMLGQTLPPVKSAWEWFGYIENIHYVVGIKPPKHFEKPYHSPVRYDNVITFWNGTTIVLGSFDRPQFMRGGSYDWIVSDESLLIKKDVYDQIVIPTLRGTHPKLKEKPGHLEQIFASSMPYKTMGQWLLDYEQLSKDHEDDVFYIEGTSWHNRVILGEKVLTMWKRTLPALIYDIEVMNKRTVRIGELFYPALHERHWYTETYNYNFIDKLGMDIDMQKRDSRWDEDCDPALPINISHDWGAFNGMTIDQYFRDKNEVRFINEMHVQHPDTIDDLADSFCKYYSYHQKKVVYQWGDKSGAKREANAKVTYFEQFAAILRKNGWRVIRQKIGDIPHLSRHNFIINLHKEQDPHLPRIRHNAINCKDLRIALENAGMRKEKKDKRSEVNPSIKQEHATHLTDAYDYRLYWGFHNIEAGLVPAGEVSFGTH